MPATDTPAQPGGDQAEGSLRARLGPVAPVLGEGWTAEDGENDRRAHLAGPGGLRLLVTDNGNPAVQRGRWRITAVFDGGLSEHVDGRAPAISVSASRPAAAVAGDINRRLLPDYRARLTTARARKADSDDADAARDRLVDDLIAALGGDATSASSRQGGHVGVELGRIGDPVRLHADVPAGPGEVKMNLELAQPIARRLAAFLGVLAAGHDEAGAAALLAQIRELAVRARGAAQVYGAACARVERGDDDQRGEPSNQEVWDRDDAGVHLADDLWPLFTLLGLHPGGAAAVALVCVGCGSTGRPVTARGYCSVCAASTCAEGDGEAAGLPVPDDVDAAVEALRHHLVEVHGAEEREHPECLICQLASPECVECGLRTDDMDRDELARHVVVDAGNGAADAVAVGCEEYVAPAVRAAGIAPGPGGVGQLPPGSGGGPAPHQDQEPR